MFFSKLWILIYQGWVIIYLFIYVPVFNKSLIEEEISINNLSYYTIFFNYYYNLIKLSYTYEYFNNNLGFKNDF